MDKRCSKCGETKDISAFNWQKDARRPGGGLYKSHCRECTTQARREWGVLHPHIPKPPRPLQTEKQCNRCGIVKPAADFYTVPHYTRLMPYCKACLHQQRAAKYRANPAKGIADALAWARKNRQRKNANGAHYRARSKHAPVVERIDRAAIIARDEGTCYLCGCKPVGRSLHLDHVIPLSRGGSHTADNLRVCCHRCNSRKWRHLLTELQGQHIVD